MTRPPRGYRIAPPAAIDSPAASPLTSEIADSGATAPGGRTRRLAVDQVAAVPPLSAPLPVAPPLPVPATEEPPLYQRQRRSVAGSGPPRAYAVRPVLAAWRPLMTRYRYGSREAGTTR
ncbi:hypothetical protein Asera_23910 [Actinocatenispora sera]|uniref:Uncharacterized protein n=1 Tax=Actinocatenispora sera TaxID=390989 RepID=A0A810KYL4_9ACTN|nr:hypothetical protein Asera_23910 [Actinocatenispora sera]